MAMTDRTARTTGLSITSAVVSDLAAAATTPFGCYIAGPSDPLSDEARELEKSVFYDTFGNSPELLAAEYGPYDDACVFVVVVDHNLARIAGMGRIILDRHGVLKSLADMERAPWSVSLDDVLERSGMSDFDSSEAMDVATLAVDPDYRGGKAGDLMSFALLQAMASLVHAADMKWIITILDVVVLELVQAKLAGQFSYFVDVEPKRYLDSPSSVPVYCRLSDYRERLRVDDPALEEVLFLGKGFESVISPADVERAAEVVRSLTSTPTIDLRDPSHVTIGDEAIELAD
ncbi:MAG TPA: hypothetical protein VMW08_06025 [Acidimicrobiales bacterium]|nr:hypothetical protein [Acidimicrobiales bacterium]